MKISTEQVQEIYEAAVHEEATGSEEAGYALLCTLEDTGGTGATIRKLIDMVRARDVDLLAVREARPVFFIEIEGDDWINAGRVPGSAFDFNNLPDGINLLYSAPPAPAPAVPAELLDAMAEVIRISDRNHEAWNRAKAAISACRTAKPVAPIEMTGALAMTKFGVKRSNYTQWVKGWNACRAAMLATVPDEIDIFVDQVCGNLPAGHQQ